MAKIERSITNLDWVS